MIDRNLPYRFLRGQPLNTVVYQILNINSLYQCSCKQCCAIAVYAMCCTLLLIHVDTGLQELYLSFVVIGILFIVYCFVYQKLYKSNKISKRSHRAYKEWAPSVRWLEQNIIIITHGKINRRATVNLKINILESSTKHSFRLKKAKWQKEKINKIK